MKRNTEFRRNPTEIAMDNEIHYGCLEDEKPLEQAVKDFERPAYKSQIITKKERTK